MGDWKLQDTGGPHAVLDSALVKDLDCLRKVVHVVREAGYRTIIGLPAPDPEVVKLVDCIVPEGFNLIYYNDDTLFFDPKNLKESLPSLRVFMAKKNKEIKSRFGVSPLELQAMPGKFTYATHNYICNNVSPVHITIHKLER
jgi:hypothetical protein